MGPIFGLRPRVRPGKGRFGGMTRSVTLHVMQNGHTVREPPRVQKGYGKQAVRSYSGHAAVSLNYARTGGSLRSDARPPI